MGTYIIFSSNFASVGRLGDKGGQALASKNLSHHRIFRCLTEKKKPNPRQIQIAYALINIFNILSAIKTTSLPTPGEAESLMSIVIFLNIIAQVGAAVVP